MLILQILVRLFQFSNELNFGGWVFQFSSAWSRRPKPDQEDEHIFIGRWHSLVKLVVSCSCGFTWIRLSHPHSIITICLRVKQVDIIFEWHEAWYAIYFLLARSFACSLGLLLVCTLTRVLQFDFGHVGLITHELVDFSHCSYDWVVGKFSVWVGWCWMTNRFILLPSFFMKKIQSIFHRFRGYVICLEMWMTMIELVPV